MTQKNPQGHRMIYQTPNNKIEPHEKQRLNKGVRQI